MSNLDKNNSMCLYPWNSVAIRPSGMTIPCCRYNIANTTDFLKESNINLDFRNSSTWVKTRQSMLSGKKIKSCFRCYKDEDNGFESMRTLSLKDYTNHDDLANLDIKTLPSINFPKDDNILPLTFLEIAFSNLCNLACVSCNRSYSSTWAAEDHKNKRLLIGEKALIEHDSDLSNIDLTNLLILKIIGGEPFMDQKKFITLLNRLDLKNLKIIISTNGTVLPNDELKFLIDQCKYVILTVSLDGIDSVNDWYRWPSKFSKIKSTIDQFDNWWGGNNKFLLEFHSVINIYNIWTLDKIVLFANQYTSWGIDFDWIINPSWQHISVIPESLKSELINDLNLWYNTIIPNIRFGKSNPFNTSINRLTIENTNNNSLDQFKSFSLSLAKERKLNLLELVPQIEKIINY